nr:DUF4865 family protein [Streptomyces sp. SID5785]
MTAHYSIVLPADYDMDVVTRRVADRSGPWDSRAGLLLKAFCATHVTDTGHNSYAPFYVWEHTDEFRRFLTGPEYAGLCAAFGPVPVRTGTVLHCRIGTGPAGLLVSESLPLGDPTDLRRTAAEETERHHSALADPSVHSHIVDLDPHTMTLTRRTLLHATSEPPQPKNGERVARVLHLSRPHRTTDA